MRCLKCESQYSERIGTISLSDASIGTYEVENVKYYECQSCANRLFPRETAIKIEEKEKEVRSSLIKKLPVGDFIASAEAADILNISRQALHKHRRIKNGFVYYIQKAGKRLYHKKSVEMFKQTGDGRFNLVDAIKPVEKVYVTVIVDPITMKTFKDEPAEPLYAGRVRETKIDPKQKYIQ